MAIKRYIATDDTTITNAFEQNFRTRGTGSNMGASDVVEVFSIYGQQSSASVELSRALLNFPIDQVITDRNNGDIPVSGSVKFNLRMFNARHASSLPKSAVYTVAAVSQSWEEGIGLDMESYTDLTYEKTGSNWIHRGKDATWGSIGGSFHDSPRFDTTLANGDEDLSVDITHLVEQWVTGENFGEGGPNRKMNYGVGVFLTSSQEAYSPVAIASKVQQNLTGSKHSYYTKKFFARGSQYWFKRPCIEARWDSSIKDNAGNFNYYSPLIPVCENINTIYFYNIVDGQLKTIPALPSNQIFVSLYSASSDSAFTEKHSGARIPSPGQGTDYLRAGTKLALKSASCSNWVRDGGTAMKGIPVASNSATEATGGQTQTPGIYSCSIALTASDNSAELNRLWAVWHAQNTSGARIEFYTASITPRIIKPYSNNYQGRYVTSCPSLRGNYYKNENARFRFFIREKNWNPTVFVQATAEPKTKIIEDAYYRVYRVADNLPVIDYGTGSTSNNYSRLSYDISGNYFDLDMSGLQPDYAYGVKLAYYLNGTYVEQPESFKFRVEES